MKKRITITLTPQLIKQAKIQAVNDDIKFSTLIEQLLRQWLTDVTKKQDKRG